MKTFWKSSAAAAILGTAMLASPALAQDSQTDSVEIAMEIVEYRDLDLSTDSGQRELRARLRDAARYVCGMDVRATGSRFASPEARQCYAERLDWIDREVSMRAERQTRRA